MTYTTTQQRNTDALLDELSRVKEQRDQALKTVEILRNGGDQAGKALAWHQGQTAAPGTPCPYSTREETT